ncbi:hypothetical protein NE865_04513 [Phthorimaea operculella]|nr:hypothetical protein NE865_04513 [Phthorimaea operculella]
MDATHFPHNGPPSLLDLAISSSPELVAAYGQFNAPAFSQHDLIYASFKIRPPKRRHKTIVIRDYSRIDKEAFERDLAAADWGLVFGSDDVDGKVAAFQLLLISLYDKHAPLKEVRVKHYPAPWLTPAIKKVMARRDAARIKARHDPSEGNVRAYHELRNICNKMCRNAKRSHIHSTIHDCPPHKLWKYLKSLGVGDSKAEATISLDLDDLNKYFGSSPVNIAPDVKTRTLSQLADCPLSAPVPLKLGQLTVSEVVRVLKSIKTRAIACRTKTFSQSFTIGAARLWNKIPTDVRKSSNIITFKLNLRKLWGVDQNDSDDL